MSDFNKPGCFGSVLSFSSTDETCLGCRHQAACEETAYSSLLEMRDVMDVSTLEKKFNIHRIKVGKHVENPVLEFGSEPKAREVLTNAQRAILEDDNLPVKPRKLIGQIFRKGYDGEFIRKSLSAGINPFAGQKPAILENAFTMVLNANNRVFQKKDLYQTYLEMGMAKRTAHSQVSIVIAAMEIMGVFEVNHRAVTVSLKGE